jgi:NADH dehydrogenase [ubiquinone] 1 alpha subcomplex assembly factor 1
MNLPTDARLLFDFPDATALTHWEFVNDGVMGGLSRSRLTVANGVGVFAGEVSLANSGGFASVRSRPAALEADGTTGFLVRVRGDGHRYKFTARLGREFDGVVYQQRFTTRRGIWQESWLPFGRFVPTFRGRSLSDLPPLAPEGLGSVGFLIADQQEGPFRLEIAWIKVAAEAPTAGVNSPAAV